MKKLILCGAIAASLTGTAYAVELKGEIATGYDSNPYRLSDSLDDGEAWFVDTNVLANQKFGKFKLSGALKNRAHEGSFNNADVLTGKLKGRYKSKYTVMGKKFSSSAAVETGFKDKTYVSRTTGKIGTFGAKKIEDRYDYDYWKLSTSSSIWLNDQVKTSLALSYQNKSYDDQNMLIGITHFPQYPQRLIYYIHLDVLIVNQNTQKRSYQTKLFTYSQKM